MEFKNSLKLLKENFFIIAGIDFLFSLIVYLLKDFFITGVKEYFFMLQPILQKFQGITNEMDLDILVDYGKEFDLMSGLFQKIIVMLVIFLILLYLLFVIFQGLNWNLSYRATKRRLKFRDLKKIDFGYLLKFGISTLFFLGIIFGLSYLIGFSFVNLIIVLLGFYFLLICYVVLNKEGFFKAIKKSFILGVKKFYLFLLMYLLIFIVFLVFSVVSYLFREFFLNLKGVFGFVLGVVLILVFLVWARFFIILNVKKLD